MGNQAKNPISNALEPDKPHDEATKLWVIEAHQKDARSSQHAMCAVVGLTRNFAQAVQTLGAQMAQSFASWSTLPGLGSGSFKTALNLSFAYPAIAVRWDNGKPAQGGWTLCVEQEKQTLSFNSTEHDLITLGLDIAMLLKQFEEQQLDEAHVHARDLFEFEADLEDALDDWGLDPALEDPLRKAHQAVLAHLQAMSERDFALNAPSAT